ncbi:MAG: hypothetical protein IPJ65_16205 [Archangiaceae bacterium]|nr:hypothetical protein [Archangiaceae bacterium]
MSRSEIYRTQFAQRAVTIADLFGNSVGKTPVEGPVSHRVEMAVPEGLSTGGGARSVQHIRLVPIEGGAAIVIGSCDQVEMTATLRSWELVAEQYGQRYKGKRLPVDAVEYGKLLLRIEEFFRENTMRVDKQDVDRSAVAVTSSPPAAEAPRAPEVLRAAPSVPWIIALVAAGMVLGAALMFTLMHR